MCPHYAVFRSSGRRQPVLHGVVVAGNNLPAKTLRKMDHQRRLKIQRQCAVRVADDHQHLRVVRIAKTEWLDFAPGHPDL